LDYFLWQYKEFTWLGFLFNFFSTDSTNIACYVDHKIKIKVCYFSSVGINRATILNLDKTISSIRNIMCN